MHDNKMEINLRTIYGFIYTLRPYERGIQETLGKYNRFVMPGLGVQIPLVHIVRVRDVREHTMDIEPQPVITKDNVEITVDGVMWVRPTVDEEGIKRTFYNIDDWKRAVIQLAMTNLRQEFAEGEREAVIQVAQGKAEAIRLVNEAAEKYFIGNAQELKKLEMIENSLRDNAKIVITEHGISPTLLLGSLPVNITNEKGTK